MSIYTTITIQRKRAEELLFKLMIDNSKLKSEIASMGLDELNDKINYFAYNEKEKVAKHYPIFSNFNVVE